MSLAVAAYRHLMASPIINELVSDGYLGSDSKYPAWVFVDAEGDPHREVRDSGKCAIVLSHTGYWALQNIHNTAHFPVVRVLIYADSDRDPTTGIILKRNAADKCDYIYRKINPLFHDVGKQYTSFGSMRIHDIVAGSAFSITEMPDASGTAYGSIMYNVSTD